MIPIYKHEQDLAQKLENNKVVADCQLSKAKFDIQKDHLLLEAIASEYDKDLYPVSTILVSAGRNGNDDVFAIEELVKAKYTPEHKPLNKEHKSREIVGHITRSILVDDKLNILEDENEDEIDDCHILAEGVIYRHIGTRDEDLRDETEDFIEELENGDWFVSMETLFSDFDYAVEHPTLGNFIVKRNDENSYLTKYLRAYGGTGQFKEYTIGRLLRNLTFSAEGFVKNPANPKSLVLNNRKFESSANLITDFSTIANKDVQMSEINFEAKYNESLAEIKELKGKLADIDKQAYAKQLEDNKTLIDELTGTIAEKEKAIDELIKKQKEDSDEIKGLEAGLEDLNKKLEEAKAELDKADAEKLRINRIAIMVDAGIDKAEAEEFVDKFISVNDEQFTSIVELRKSKASEVKTEDVEAVENVDEIDEDAVGEQNIDETEIDNEEVDETTLASEAENSVKSGLENYFSNVLVKK